MGEPAKGGRRRRGRELEEAIFDAVIAEVSELGYYGTSMEGVAARARTGKAALYRRWPGKDELIGDALDARMPMPPSAPDTGDVREDLLALLRTMARFLRSDAGGAMHRLIGDISDTSHPNGLGECCPAMFVELKRRAIARRKALLREVLERAARRGEVAPEATTDRIVELGPSLIVAHTLAHGPVPDDEVVAIVDEILLPLIAVRR